MKLLFKIIGLLYLLVGFIDNFGAADKSVTQVLYLSALNFLVITIILIVKKERIKFLSSINNNILFKVMFLFICWASITILFAVNKLESLRVLTDQIAYISAIGVLYYIFNKEGVKTFFLKIIPILVSLEIFYVLNPYLYDFFIGNEIIQRSASYKGITGNINVAAFSIVMKLQFVIRNVFRGKRYFRILNFIIYFLGLYVVIEILQTRGAYLAIAGVLILNAIWLIYNDIKKENFFKRLVNFSYLIFPLLIILLNSSLQKDSNSIQRIKTISTLNDGSSSERLRYYQHSLNSIIEKPLFGVGIGNWELESIKRDYDYITNYIISYHVHNDFFEIAAETGIEGFILYYGLGLFILIFLFLKILKKKMIEIEFLIFVSVSVFFVDSFLNFPFARPIQMTFYFILLLLFLTEIKVDSFSFFRKLKFNKYFLVLIVFLPLNVYASFRVYKSYFEQYRVLGEFNASQFLTPLEKIKLIEDEFPSIGPTTIPLKTHKGIYYLKNDSLEQAKNLFKRGIKDNPYLKISEAYLGYTYLKLKIMDSALYYTKDAFYTLPNNAVHYTYYLSVLAELNDTDEITKAYNKIKNSYNNEIIHEIYYLAISKLLNTNESKKILNELSTDLLLSKNDNLKKNIFVAKYGVTNVYEAGINHEKGLSLFNQNKYQESLKFFERAAELNQLESPYYENAANAYIKVGNNERALYFINFILENLNPENAKVHYMKALIQIENGEMEKACNSLTNAKSFGFRGSSRVYDAYCQ